MTQGSSIQELYERLYAQYGPQGWWPAKTRAEMIIGAILTQNTAWTNVKRAIANLRKRKALNFKVLRRMSPAEIAGQIRPSGYFNQKAATLKAFSMALDNEFGGSLDRLFRLDTPALRKKLLAVKGIGPETADSILLYAAKRPLFVVDAYTRRFLAANGYKKQSGGPYDEIAALFLVGLPANVEIFNEYHALIVRWGKDYSLPHRTVRGKSPE